MKKKVFKRLLLAALLVVPWAATAQLTLPVTMDFENETAYNSWSVVNGATGWSVGTGRNSDNARNGAYCFKFFYSTNPPQYLISPELSPLTAPAQVEFWYKAGMSYYTETFMLGWSSTTNAPDAFTWGTEVSSNSTDYQKFEGIVPAGTKYVCIKYTANDQYFLYIDDIVIQDPPTCLAVTGLTAGATDSASITLSWNDEMNTGASYSVACWAAGDTTWLTSATTSLTVGNLDASTAYHFLVRAICSATDSSAAVSGTFRTECGQITLPYIVDFEDAAYNGAWYPCWDSVIHAGTDPSVNDQNSPANHTPDGTYAMYLQGNSSQPYNLVVSPRVPLPGDQIFVSFWARRASNCWIKAGVITNPHDTSTFIPLAEVGSNSWEEYSFSTAGLDPNATYYVAWMGYGYGYYGSTFIGKFDDVVIRQDNGCNKPNMAVVDSVGPYTAYLTWTTGGASATSYDLLYGTTNNIDNAMVETVNDLNDTVHYALGGLLPQTTYYVWVRTNCGSDASDPKPFGSLTTQMTCAPVINATMGNISYTAAVINWAYDSTVGFPTGGVRIVMTDNTDANAAPVEVDVTGTAYTLGNLLPGHSYTVMLRNYCDVGDQVDTAGAVSVTFMTTSCAEVATDNSSNTSIPTNTYYNYSYAQAIYTVAQMPDIDTIHGLAFMANTAVNNNIRTVDVYMGHTSLSAFPNDNGWIPYDSLTRVASNVTIDVTSTGWKSIPFDTAFVYDGIRNLVVAVDDNTGSWKSSPQWASVAATSQQGLATSSDGTDYQPSNPGSGTLQNNIPAVSFMASCEVPECFAPMLSFDVVDSTSISVNWVSVGTESEWAVGIKSGTGAINWSASSVTDTFYTFSGLNANTLYDIYVGSLCNGDTLVSTLSVKTLCGSMGLPFSTSFEGDAMDAVPSCWTVLSSYAYGRYDYATYSYIYTDYPAVSDGANSGSHSLGFVSENVSTLIASSALPANGESLVVGFWAQTDDDNGYTTLTLEAGLMTDLTDDSTFVPMITLTGSNDYAQYEFVTPVLAVDSTYYLAFRYSASNYWGGANVDDINIRMDDGCHRPDSMVAYGTDTNKITVSWSDDGIMNNYTVRYRVKGTTAWSSVEGLASTQTDLTGLSTATAYEIMVGTACTTDTLWTTVAIARTLCAPMVLPYSTSFENDVVGEMPACWNNSGATGSSYDGLVFPGVADGYNTEAHTGDKALTFYYISTGTSIVSSDPVPLPGDSIYVSFWGRREDNTYYSAPILEAGVMTNPAVDSTFIPLASVTTDTYQRYEFNTSTLNSNNTYYVAFRYTSTYEYNMGVIDDINISLDEGCHYPDNVTAVALNDSIIVSWTANGTVNNFVVQHRAGGGVWSVPNPSNGLADTLTGLSYATSYEVRVGNVCGNDTLWAFAFAQTPCALMDVPYYEPFYSATMDVPPCWDFTDPSRFGFNNWIIDPVDGHGYSGPGDGTLMAKTNSAYEYAILPALNASFSKLQISFKAKLGNISEGDSMVFGVYDEITGMVHVAGKMADPNQSREEPVVFTYNYLNYNGPGNRIAISHTHNEGSGMYAEWGFEMDSLMVIELPGCFPPANIKAHNTMYPNTADDVYFTWTPQGDAAEWQVYMDTITSTIDPDSVSASQLITVTDTMYQPDYGQLADGAKYRFFVRSKCLGDSYSNWVELQNGVATDEVWMNNSSTADTVTGCDFIVYDNGGPIAGYLHNSNSKLVIRTIENGRQPQIQGAKIKLGEHTPSLTIYDGTDATGTALFSINTASLDTVFNIPIATSTTGALTVVFTSGYAAAAGYELYVHCIGQASCPKPDQLYPTINADHSADIIWSGTASTYHVYYKLSTADNWTMQTVNGNNIHLTGLTDSVTYDLYVVALCSATDSSIASNVLHFNSHYTEPQAECPAVSNVNVTNVTVTSARVSWTAPAGTNRWEVELTSEENTVTFTSTQSYYGFTGLSDSTEYRVRVRTICDEDEELYSDWSDYVVFTTRHQHNTEGIDDVVGSANFTLYPNPTSTTVTLDLRSFEGAAEVSIIDQSGRTVFHGKTNSSRMTVDVTGYASGAYFVRVTSSNASAIRKLVVK